MPHVPAQRPPDPDLAPRHRIRRHLRREILRRKTASKGSKDFCRAARARAPSLGAARDISRYLPRFLRLLWPRAQGSRGLQGEACSSRFAPCCSARRDICLHSNGIPRLLRGGGRGWKPLPGSPRCYPRVPAKKRFCAWIPVILGANYRSPLSDAPWGGPAQRMGCGRRRSRTRPRRVECRSR